MKFDTIASIVGGTPFITMRNARYLYDMILRDRPREILELGIAHGAGTCYMAAALHEIGAGRITAVDLLDVDYAPSAEELLARAGLASIVDVVRMKTGYTWFLHDDIARQTEGGQTTEKYDLCIIDGPKNWTIDGCAFFLADKLLRPGSTIIFDDYDWTYADSGRDATDGISNRTLSQEERTTPHIREVFELLVKQHPHYSDFVLRIDDGWAIARKHPNAEAKRVKIEYSIGNRDLLARLALKLRRFFPAATGRPR